MAAGGVGEEEGRESFRPLRSLDVFAGCGGQCFPASVVLVN